MSTKMTKEEREQFLKDVRVGVLSIADGDRGPLTVPVWYDYEPGGTLWFLTSPESMKGKRLESVERVSLCVQTETAPYKYVSVEGPLLHGRHNPKVPTPLPWLIAISVKKWVMPILRRPRAIARQHSIGFSRRGG